jgi:hypothetical protein
MKKYHVLTHRTHTINKILTLCILIINKFHHNRKLILITTRKSLSLVLDKIRPHFRQVSNIRQVQINIHQVPNISQVLNIIPIQQLVVDFHRYIQRVRDVPHQHPTQAFRNPRSNLELTREGRELPELMIHLGDAITNKL